MYLYLVFHSLPKIKYSPINAMELQHLRLHLRNRDVSLK